jgi:hypothetical protein
MLKNCLKYQLDKKFSATAARLAATLKAFLDARCKRI